MAITIKFEYKGEVRTGTVEVDTTNRKGLVLLMTEKGYRSFKCDEVTNVQYLP